MRSNKNSNTNPYLEGIMSSRSSMLQQLLHERRISQSQMAMETGISYSYLNRIIRGWVVPSEKIQHEITEFLGIAEQELWPK